MRRCLTVEENLTQDAVITSLSTPCKYLLATPDDLLASQPKLNAFVLPALLFPVCDIAFLLPLSTIIINLDCTVRFVLPVPPSVPYYELLHIVRQINASEIRVVSG